VTFEQLVKIMVEADVAAVKNEVFGPVDATVP
jgi:hypothetical protein